MRVIRPIRFWYVSTDSINSIKKQALGKSLWTWVKSQLKIGKLIMSEGYKEAKSDISFLSKNFNNKLLTSQQQKRRYQAIVNLLKVPPIAILFMFPGGLPIVLLYMAYLPALTPTWFLTDHFQKNIVQQRLANQKKALAYFYNCGSIFRDEQSNQIKTTINTDVFQSMCYDEKKKIMQLCFGQSFDGTNIIRRTFRLRLDSFISATLSSSIMSYHLKRKLSYEKGEEIHGKDPLTQKVLKEVKKVEKISDQKIAIQ